MSTRHFKKYANRKFYDEERGQYASVEEIAAVVKRGDDVVMTCDRTGRDLTLEILTRILYEEVRRAGKVGGESFPGRSRILRKVALPAGLKPVDVARLVRLF